MEDRKLLIRVYKDDQLEGIYDCSDLTLREVEEILDIQTKLGRTFSYTFTPPLRTPIRERKVAAK